MLGNPTLLRGNEIHAPEDCIVFLKHDAARVAGNAKLFLDSEVYNGQLY
jgi:hypothetical protein